MNLELSFNQFLAAATGGAYDGQFDIHALPGIRTQAFCVAAADPQGINQETAKFWRRL